MLNDLGGIFSQFFGGGQRPSAPPALEELQEWVSELARHAIQKWGITMLGGMPCNCVKGCSRTAVGACVVCRKPTCLAHSFASSDAFIACHACVHAASVGQGQQPPRHAPKRERQPSEEELQEELRKKHLKTMKLTLDADEEDIRAAFKKFVAKSHPDRAPEEKREAATKKFVEVKAAYEWLIANPLKQAA